jgi:hypothetical protein
MARDPNRIGRILTKLHKAWQLEPEQRLGQLLSNLLWSIEEPFYVEDEAWERLLDEFIAKGDKA